ncbi:MAG: response regulator [Candidatus Eisenbacteria bacterium]
MSWAGKHPAGLRLFLADGAESVAMQVRGWAAASGGRFTVEAFRSSHQLLRRSACERPDAVLLDLTMPRMDGLTALRSLAPTGIPAIMLSGQTHDGARATMEALIAGAADCLIKTRRNDVERIAATRQEFSARVRRVVLGAEQATGREGERPVWRKIEIDDEGRIVAGRPTLDPFPHQGSWFGLALSPPRCLGKMIHTLSAAPERPLGGMLLGAGLPPRFTRALAEAATRQWNRVVLEVCDGEQLRPSQWRVIPGRRLARFHGGERQALRVELRAGRRSSRTDPLLQQIEFLLPAPPPGLRLYLFEQPDPRGWEALEQLISRGATVLVQGRGAAVLRFERDEEWANDTETRVWKTQRRAA